MVGQNRQGGVDGEALQRRLEEVQRRVEEAIARRGSEGPPVELVAVSKTHPVEAIRVLYEAGILSFGESYVQEWEEKAPLLPEDIRWHFIGRLQSNKARFLTDQVELIHSVDRKSLMRALQRRSENPVEVLLQVNLGMQKTKGGVAFEDLERVMEQAANYPNLRVRGLMGMPPYAEDPEASRPYFQRLRQGLEELQGFVERRFPERREELTELSMGMSNDFEVAIEEGATIVRVGTVLFGERRYDE